MEHRCVVRGKTIGPFDMYWLREPNDYGPNGYCAAPTKPKPFCSYGCLFGYTGKWVRRQKKQRG